MTPPRSSEEPTLREMERADPFAPHAGGCQCWPHVSQRAAVEGAVQAATAEYRAVRDREADPEVIRAEFQRFYDFVAEADLSIIDAYHFTENVRAGMLARGESVDRGADPLRKAVRTALNELGVPNEDYPAPVANAVNILRAALGEEPQ